MGHDNLLSVVCQEGLSSEICPFLPFAEVLSVCEAALAIWCYRNRQGTPDDILAAGQSFTSLVISISHLPHFTYILVSCSALIQSSPNHLFPVCFNQT